MSLSWHDKLNAETPPADLAENYYTPVDKVFVRNHGVIPELDERTYAFDIVVEKEAAIHAAERACAALADCKPSRWTMEDVKSRVKAQKVTIALECAGNHRSKMNEMRMTKGIPWRSGAIANLEWEGPLLRDVLLNIGVPDPLAADQSVAGWTQGLHVHFESAQKCQEADWYGSSIPLSEAMRPDLPILLAYKQNGVSLTREHGYPLRVVVPGYIGARSVKWLSRIRILPQESDNFYMRYDYKIVVPDSVEEIDMIQDNPEYRRRKMMTVRPMMEMDLGGGITAPEDGATVGRGLLKCRGYAIGEKGSPITTVQVAALATPACATGEEVKSLAACKSVKWTQAVFRPQSVPTSYQGKEWGWTLWDAEVAVPELKEGETAALVMRLATAEVVQPQTVPWNVRGVGMRGWSVVKGLKVV